MQRFGAISVSALLCLAGGANAQQFADFAPPFNACAHTHGDPAQYLATIAEEGWTVTEDRDAAIARLADSFLPVLGPSSLPWADMVAARADAGTSITDDILKDRDIYEQDGHLLLISGHIVENDAFRVDCWLVLPDDTLNDAVFETAEDQTLLPQIRMAAFAGPEHSDGSVTRIMAVQLEPDTPVDPPLAGRNGLYIQTLVPAASAEESTSEGEASE